MYYLERARKIALNNNQSYHIAAWAKKRGSYVFGVNSRRCSAQFEREHENGYKCYYLHAEMDLIKKIGSGNTSTIYVARFGKDGSTTMAMPCKWCQKALLKNGIRKAYYTNWDGDWEVLRL